jgi:O-antigen ligase
MERFGDFIAEKWGERVANAHNEYLQYLVTMGLAGLAAYAGIYLSALKEYWKKESWSISRMAALAGILGYMGQAAVNNPQALNMATLFVLLAIFRREKIEGKCEVK